MQKIRYTQRICKDKDKIQRFLREKRVGTISMCENGGRTYAVPVNYIYWQDKIYFHGMGTGKKNNILAASPSVCFTVFEEFGTVGDAMPAKCDTSYLSVVIFGQAVLVEDIEEKTEALREFLEKFMPGYFKAPLSAEFVAAYRSGHDQHAVAVYRISPEELTAKENPLDEEHMFSVL